METKLLQRARKKFLSSALAHQLVQLNSPLKKSYAKSTACQSQLVIDNDYNITSPYYCRSRWCMTCASIKMATQINNYYQPLHQLDQPLYFITLTRRTVPKESLEVALKDMQSTWRKITDLARKQQLPYFAGLRKTELKVAKGGQYHPHYHIIAATETAAQFIIDQWLKRSPTASPLAQDMRPINNLDNALIELMKYATKLTCADDSSNQILCSAAQMDTIFQHLYKKRLYQPFGGLKLSINEDNMDIQSEQIIKRAKGLYEWLGHDWYHVEFGQPLSGWVPEGSEIQLYRSRR